MEALFALGVVRVLLVFVRFDDLQRMLVGTVARDDRLPTPSAEIEEVARRVTRAVSRARRCIPGTRCLPTALTVQVLLARRGIPSALRIGIIPGPGVPAGHAWVEVGHGGPVFGGAPDCLALPPRHTPIP